MLNSPLVIVARTDAEAATMIDSNIDPIDHPHIKGVTAPWGFLASEFSPPRGPGLEQLFGFGPSQWQVNRLFLLGLDLLSDKQAV